MQFRLKYENIVILLILDSTFVAHLQNCISISSHLIILTLIAFEQQPELTFILFTTLKSQYMSHVQRYALNSPIANKGHSMR